MSEGVVIRPYAQGDEEKIIRLLQTVFDGWPHLDLQCSSLDHWRWKFEDNPLKMKAATVAESGGKIVGCNHGFYLKLKMGRKSLLAQQGTDLAVHKAFRGKGLSTKLAALKRKYHEEVNANITYSLSTNPIVLKHDLKTNRPQFPSPIKHMIKVKDIDLHLRMADSSNRLTKKYGFIILNTLNRLKNSMIPSHHQGGSTTNFEISEIKRFDEEIEAFWDEVKDDYSFIVERGMDYLNWRYCDRRGGDYVVRQAVEGGRILGYIVLRVNRYNRDYPLGYVVDMLTLPGRLDVADALIRDADGYFKERGVNIVHALVIKGHPYERLFEGNKFFNDRIRYYLFYRPYSVGEELDEFKNAPPSRLHFVWGDLDWI